VLNQLLQGQPSRVAPMVEGARLPGEVNPGPTRALLLDHHTLPKQGLGRDPAHKPAAVLRPEGCRPGLHIGAGTERKTVDLTRGRGIGPNGGYGHPDEGWTTHVHRPRPKSGLNLCNRTSDHGESRTGLCFTRSTPPGGGPPWQTAAGAT